MERRVFPISEREAKGVKWEKGQSRSKHNRETLFVKRLKELRSNKGLSQNELAKKLGVTKSTVSLWECGDTIPDAKSIYNLSVIYGVSADYILGRSQSNATSNEVRILTDDFNLSPRAARSLSEISCLGNRNEAKLAAFNRLLESAEFEAILKELAFCMRFGSTITLFEAAVENGTFTDEVASIIANKDIHKRRDRGIYRSGTLYNLQYWIEKLGERLIKESEKQAETARGDQSAEDGQSKGENQHG